ncbi:MAG: hypothetical protein RL217_285 [Pseudomonadota bacterium]
MRAWNGWGNGHYAMTLPAIGQAFLAQRIGNGHKLGDASLESVCKKVPPSRLPVAHPLIKTDAETRVRYARGQSLPDWLALRSGEFEHFPDAVAFPECSNQVAELLALAKSYDLEVIPYGGGTSVAGHINPKASKRPVLTVSLERMNRLLDLDVTSQIATFGAGTPGPLLEQQLRAQGFTLGHFPQSFELSTVGGWVASRSSGQQSLRYGRIEQLFAGGRMETLLGTLDIPALPASSAGPDVREMVLGSEGRMGILTEVKVRVTPLPAQESFHVAFLPSWEAARNCARELKQRGIGLSMLRVSNAIETETQLALAGHPKQIALLELAVGFFGIKTGKCMLTFGTTGSKAQCKTALKEARQVIKARGGLYTGTYLGNKWAEKRFAMPYLREALWQLGYAVDTLETATTWDNVDSLLNKIEDNLRTGLQTQGKKVHVFTHLSHMYNQGCSIYTTYIFANGASYADTLAYWAMEKSSTSKIIVENGGTISHQHGVGKDHAPYLAVEKGELGIKAIASVLSEFDPNARMNPGTLL